MTSFIAMFRRLRAARAAAADLEGVAEGGFTLIEVMVVLLILAILLAVAIPTYLGVTGSANDRAAQSNLTNALTEAATLYQNDSQSFTGTATMLLTSFTSSAPEFRWTSGGCGVAQTDCISVDAFDVSSPGDAQGLLLADHSNDQDTCWYLLDLFASPSLATPDGAFDNTGGATGPGVWYARSSLGSSSCAATDPINGVNGFTTGSESWAQSYGSVTTAG